MSLQKCAQDMATHTDGWNLRECVKEASESWLQECLGESFDVDKFLTESAQSVQRENQTEMKSYTMSLAQQCEYAWYKKLLNSLSDCDRLRLVANSGPTQK